jgi:glycosyltransferase involved in cell wall biosynthesis
MEKTEFLTIFPTFEKLEVVKKTLQSIVEETRRNDAKLIVHDSSVRGRKEKWDYLLDLNKENDFFLILSDNLSMAHARNMCLQLGQELYAPDYVCMLEDDHGFRESLIAELVDAIKKYYGKVSPNGLRYGMFSGCAIHTNAKLIMTEDGHSYPAADQVPFNLGGFNSCFRCAPTSHWANVLKGYDTDEYLISTYQTANIRWRNYHKGFTYLIVKDGMKVFAEEGEGRGMSSEETLKLWDEKYTASDTRSNYLGKK